jgi:hypothetical protein
MRVDYTTKGNIFVPGKPRPWPDVELSDLGGASAYDVAADGKRLLIVAAKAEPNAGKPDTQLNVLLNFFDEVKRRIVP